MLFTKYIVFLLHLEKRSDAVIYVLSFQRFTRSSSFYDIFVKL